MKKNRFLKQLVTIKLEDDPQQIAADLIEVAFSDDTDAEKAEDAGEVIDDAVAFGGIAGGLLEGVDDAIAEQLAGVGLELIGQVKDRVLQRVEDQVEELEDALRDKGVSEEMLSQIRDILRLDELAAA